MMMEQIKEKSVEAASGTTYFWIGEDNMVSLLYKETISHGAEDALENIMLLRKLMNGKACLLLIDITDIKYMTREAREIYAKESVTNRISAIALYTGSSVGKIVGNFFLGFNKPEVPIKLFNDKKEAKTWLKSHKY